MTHTNTHIHSIIVGKIVHPNAPSRSTSLDDLEESVPLLKELQTSSFILSASERRNLFSGTRLNLADLRLGPTPATLEWALTIRVLASYTLEYSLFIYLLICLIIYLFIYIFTICLSIYIYSLSVYIFVFIFIYFCRIIRLYFCFCVLQGIGHTNLFATFIWLYS